MTQRELGDRLGITASAVGQWESGRTTPSWKQAQALAELFDIDTAPVSQPDSETRIRLDALEAQMVDAAERRALRLSQVTAALQDLQRRIEVLEGAQDRRASR